MSGIFDQIINYSPPLIVSGTVNYDGTWDASTNTPTLNNPPAGSTKGDYYVVSVAGTQFSLSFAVGDWIISNGTAWEKVDLTDAVSSVFGRTGAVVGVSTDYSAVGLTNTAIGASSPSTGAFTTVTASSTIAATGAVTGSNLSGTNTGDQTTISGNAGSATILQTARNINGVSFNGSADITVAAAAGTLTGATLASGVTASSLTSLGTIASLVATTADINGGTIDGTTVGATTPSTVAATTISATGNITFTGTGNRILGDYSSTPVSNKLSFQTTTTNASSYPQVIPNGTATASGFLAFNNSDPTNAAFGCILALPTEVRLFSSKEGTGTLQPVTFHVGGSERARIDTAGNVGIGTSSPAAPLDVVAASGNALSSSLRGRSADNLGIIGFFSNDGVTRISQIRSASDRLNISTLTAISLVFDTNNTERARIDSSGNVGIGTTSPATLFDVTGASGTQGNPPSSGTTAGGVARIRSLNASLGIGSTTGNSMWLQAADATSLGVYYPITLNPNGGNVGIGTLSPGSKLDVNGELRIGNTVNTVSPTSPNRTVTIVIGGTTYYLAAKTTND